MNSFVKFVFGLLFLAASACSPVKPWPPQSHEPYPDLELFDESGSTVKLSDFRGRVLLLEPVRMACPASQSFNGAQSWGSYGAVLPQAGVPELEKLLQLYSGTAPTKHSDLRVIEIIFFNMENAPPSASDLKEWNKHFHLHERNILVLGARPNLVDEDARGMVPGFQLIDRNFILRADATGSSPRSDLYKDLFPMIPKLLAE